MNTKPQVLGQWAQQQKVAEKKDEKTRSEKQSPMEQSSGAEPMKEPAKKHGDKIDVRPKGSARPNTPEDQGGIAGP